jgi:hypothetical protein
VSRGTAWQPAPAPGLSRTPRSGDLARRTDGTDPLVEQTGEPRSFVSRSSEQTTHHALKG